MPEAGSTPRPLLIVIGDDDTGLADEVARRADVGRNAGNAASHRFTESVAEAFAE